MTLELVSEEVPSAYLSTLYPFNALRNHALLLVRTEVRVLCCTGCVACTPALLSLCHTNEATSIVPVVPTCSGCRTLHQHVCGEAAMYICDA